MHHHRNAGAELAPGRAATPPPAGNVQGLGVVDALRIDVQPEQLPWLAAELDTLRYCLEDELAHRRARCNELAEAAKGEQRYPTAREAEQELERRAYQLHVLAMIREQLPISSETAAAAVARPWGEPGDDDAPAPERVEGSDAVVGPAALMTVLIRGATRNVADALGEALRGPGLDVDEHTDSAGGWRGAELPRVEPAIAEKLRAIAAAAQAFTDTYLDVLALQVYSFDPEYRPVDADELD
jgi:hypothetical protein